MSAGACPTELELERAVSVGPDTDLVAHLEGCEVCRAFYEETRCMIELARELPAALPPPHHVEERRTAMLAAWNPETIPDPVRDVPAPSRHRLRWAGIGMAIAASIASVIAVTRYTPAPPDVVIAHPRRGTVHPHDGAHFTLAAQPPDEIVRLRDGVIDIDVDPLSIGERFRVVVGTDEVEVRGTSFEVVAAADHLVSVHVVHGRVEVKRTGVAVVVLGAGEAWQAITATRAPPPPPIPVVEVAPSAIKHSAHVRSAMTAPRPESAPPPAKAADPQEAAFVRGWEAMRVSEYGQAAAAFNLAVALAPDGALSEDAMFWHAVAVARLKRTAEAVAAFRSFIDAFPTSTRMGEASSMLGWLLVETRELDEARRRFHAAEHDPNVNARASALQGLERIDRAP